MAGACLHNRIKSPMARLFPIYKPVSQAREWPLAQFKVVFSTAYRGLNPNQPPRWMISQVITLYQMGRNPGANQHYDCPGLAKACLTAVSVDRLHLLCLVIFLLGIVLITTQSVCPRSMTSRSSIAVNCCSESARNVAASFGVLILSHIGLFIAFRTAVENTWKPNGPNVIAARMAWFSQSWVS